jgi:multidrug efflux pump|tara:strand:+ start:3553 stop:6675 length:3123 start_codon:yes stop_codon:yes gene_type:complete
MLKSILTAILLQRRTILTFLVMIVLLGSISYATFPKEERPAVDLKTVAVIIAYQGLSSNEIERLITEPLERELMSLDDINEIISVSKDGVATLRVSFNLDTKIENISKLVRNKVEDSKSKLPEDIEIIEVKEYSSEMFSQIRIGIYGDVPYKVLNSTAEAYKEKFELINNVTEVEIRGGREDQIKITVIPELLKKHSVNLDEIINALRSYNNLVPAGTLSDSNAEFSVKVPSLYESYNDLEKLPIRSINNFILTLGDVALVKRSFNKTEEYVTVNGKSALNINISRKSGTNVLDTYDAVKKVLAENENSFHPLIKAVLVDDDSIGVRQRISASENTVITAVMLVMIIIVGILGLRSGVLIGLSIPLTYLFSILILDFLGMTYNLMTIFGLILAVGLLVDGPIVISEYARSEQEKGVRRRDSYINASYNMFWPIIASALTTIVAFIPLIFWPDTIGQWLKVIPVTVIVVLTTSLIVTLIFVPSLGAMIERKTADMQPSENQSNFLYLKYESILSNAIENPIKVILLTSISFILIILLYKNFNTGVQFFPDDKADSARINITARGNLSVDEKSRYINEALEVINNKPYIDQYVSNTIQRKRIWFFDADPSDVIGKIWLEFKNPENIADPDLIINEMQNELSQIVGFDATIKGNTYSSSLNAGKPIEIEVSSSNKLALNQTAEIIRNKLNEVDGLNNIEIQYPLSGVEWKYDIDRNMTSKHNVPVRLIGSVISLATDGLKIGSLRPINSSEEIDIKVYLPDEQRTLDQVENITINTPQGSLPIKEFVNKRPTNKIYSISRKDSKRNLIISADVDPSLNVAEKISQLKNWKNSTSLPLGVEVRLIGEAEDSESSLNFVIGAFIFSILSMFIILICLFNNFYHTFIILFSLVLSTTGIFIGLIVLQMNFSIVMTGLGIVACAGIVVNNNIILIDSYRKIRKNEKNKNKAILLSTKSRVRPILLTTITTVVGILPSALQLSVNIFDRSVNYKSAETYFTEPLAWALVWGLSFAAIATLFVTPALLALPDRLKELSFSRKKSPILSN